MVVWRRLPVVASVSQDTHNESFVEVQFNVSDQSLTSE
jgi:hypothetical protein